MNWLAAQSEQQIRNKRAEADLLFRRVGITFAVNGDLSGTERLIPFDMIPRIIPGDEWRTLEAGLRQRVQALNLFIHDVYHDHDIVRAGMIPAEQVYTNAQYRPEMQGVDVPLDVYAHIAGVDVVRAGDAGEFYVLEDNLRVPSGVSYMLENRKMMMRLFPELFVQNRIAPVAHYPDLLLETLRSIAPGRRRRPGSSWCSRRACTTRRTSSTRSSRSRWAWNWWKARICSSMKTTCSCARRKGRSAST